MSLLSGLELLINTGLQPGGIRPDVLEPFQRFPGREQTVEAVRVFSDCHHRAEARC